MASFPPPAAGSTAPGTPTDVELARRHARRERKRQRRAAVAWWSVRVQAGAWVGVALAAFVAARLGEVLGDPETHGARGGWLAAAAAFTGASVVGLGFMAWKLPPSPPALGLGTLSAEAEAHARRSLAEADYDRFPRVLPATVAAWVAGFVCSCIALWPVYRGLTPFLVSLEWWAALMSAHFLPGF